MRIPARDLLPPVERYTERLLLRPFRRRDIEALYAAVRDSQTELAEYLPWATKAFTRAGAAGFVRESMRSWREGKAYDFSIRLHERPERHVGNISIWHVSRSSRSGEIGYWIRTEDTGRGIATEATHEALRIGFGELSMHRMVLRVAVHLSPVTIILALLAGGSIGGLLGVLIAVPTTAVFKIIIGHLWRTRVLGESWEQAASAVVVEYEVEPLRERFRRGGAEASKAGEGDEAGPAGAGTDPADPTRSGSGDTASLTDN